MIVVCGLGVLCFLFARCCMLIVVSCWLLFVVLSRFVFVACCVSLGVYSVCCVLFGASVCCSLCVVDCFVCVVIVCCVLVDVALCLFVVWCWLHFNS